jgi:hypothetical protein
MILKQTVYALQNGLQASFQAYDGVEPYVYSVLPGGAGGTIDPDTGIYMSPANIPEDPRLSNDIIKVVDDDGEEATATISILSPLMLFCEIIQREMNLPAGRVRLWDQKIFQPTDEGVYIAVGVLTSEPFANINKSVSGSGLYEVLTDNIKSTLSLDVISRGPSALYRKDELVLALNSNYSQSQQEINSFYIGKLTPRFLNLSPVDGAAIPYRFNVTVNIQYFIKKTKEIPYFNTFQRTVNTDS